ncbi:hypothetical protein [Spiribacter pallidus]|uniref:hypothetical protein n=1 Tax=Spiribacter pallidus TaxID=1987936 RepID=UPI0034A06C1D
MRQAAPGLGLVDQPGGRKTHRHPTPVVGGLGMGFALLLALPFLLHGLDGAVGAGWLGSARPSPRCLP